MNEKTRKALHKSAPWHTPGEVEHRAAKPAPCDRPQLTAHKRGDLELNEETGRLMQTLLAAGVGYTIACEKLGLNRRIVYECLKRYREGRELTPERYAFAQLVAAGRAAIVEESVSNIRSLSRDDWKASAWLAERTAPEDFNLAQRHEILRPSDLTDDALVEQLCDAVASIDPANGFRKALFIRMCSEYPHGPQPVDVEFEVLEPAEVSDGTP